MTTTFDNIKRDIIFFIATFRHTNWIEYFVGRVIKITIAEFVNFIRNTINYLWEKRNSAAN